MEGRRLEMDDESVRAVLVQAVRRIRSDLAQASISGEEHIAAELGLDSVDRMEMLIAVEEAFGVEEDVDPRIFMIPQTINDLVGQIVVSQASLA